MIVPRESSFFQETDNQRKLVPIDKTSLYKHDKIGLKTLFESGKVSLKYITNAYHIDEASYTYTHVMFDFLPFLYAKADVAGIGKIPNDQFLFVELPESYI